MQIAVHWLPRFPTPTGKVGSLLRYFLHMAHFSGIPLDPCMGIMLVLSPFIGSFLSLLAFRLPRGEPIAITRSRCRHCDASLGVLDLVPLASWLILRGRCRHCGAPISSSYPLFEIWAVMVVLWAASETTGPVLIATSVLGWTLTLIAVIDWQYLIIPRSCLVFLASAGLIAVAAIDPAALPDHILAGISAFAFLWTVGLIYALVRNREGLGRADPFLFGAIGMWVGWGGLAGTLLIASLSGLLVALAATLAGRMPKRETMLPLGSFLAGAAWLVWLYGPLIPS